MSPYNAMQLKLCSDVIFALTDGDLKKVESEAKKIFKNTKLAHDFMEVSV